MASRTLKFDLIADIDSLRRGFTQAGQQTGRLQGTVSRASGKMRTALLGVGAAAGGATVIGLKKAASAAIEAEKSQARLEAQLKASGISYRRHAQQIDEVIGKHARLSGFDDEDLQDSFTNIVRITGDVSKSLRLTGLAADFARAKNVDVAKAGELVGKVAGGNTGILARYGIQLEKGATASEALATLQQKFGGQAEAYGKTTAGSLDRLKVAGENLGEVVGARLTPVLASAADVLSKLFADAEAGRGFGGALKSSFEAVGTGARVAYQALAPVVTGVASAVRSAFPQVQAAFVTVGNAARTVFPQIRAAVMSAFGAIANTVQQLWPRFRQAATQAFEAVRRVVLQVAPVIQRVAVANFQTLVNLARDIFPELRNIVRVAFETIGRVVRVGAAVFENVLLPIIRRVIPAVIAIIQGLARVVRGVVRVISGVLSGDFRKAWEGIKDIVSGALKAVGGIIRGATAPFREAASRIGGALKKGFEAGIRGIAALGRGVINGMIDLFNKAIGAINNATPGRISLPGPAPDIPGIPDIPLVARLHRGGKVPGRGRGDKVPALLEPGEYVVRRPAVAKAGVAFMQALNDGVLPAMRDGGLVASAADARQRQRTITRLGPFLASRFGLRLTSGYRDPQHNASVGGAPNSWHTRGTASNPGAYDLVGPWPQMRAALAWVRQNVPGLDEAMIENYGGSGWHLHVGGTGVMQFTGATSGGAGQPATSTPGRAPRTPRGPSRAQKQRAAFQKHQRDQARTQARQVRRERRSWRETPATRRDQQNADLDALENEAALTPGTEDDLAAARERERVLRARLARVERRLKGRLKPKVRARLTAQRAALLSEIGTATATISDLTTVDVDTGDGGGDDGLQRAIEENTAAQQAQADALRDLRAEAQRAQDWRETMTRTQGGTLIAGLVDALSGGIGGPVGLGYQTPGFAGGKVRY